MFSKNMTVATSDDVLMMPGEVCVSIDAATLARIKSAADSVAKVCPDVSEIRLSYPLDWPENKGEVVNHPYLIQKVEASELVLEFARSELIQVRAEALDHYSETRVYTDPIPFREIANS